MNWLASRPFKRTENRSFTISYLHFVEICLELLNLLRKINKKFELTKLLLIRVHAKITSNLALGSAYFNELNISGDPGTDFHFSSHVVFDPLLVI